MWCFETNGEQINPHLNKNICVDLTADNLIYGCGKPFSIYANNKALICDYK